ncbi:MAG: hypothetical protein DRJ51_00830 [Thermoprotei archaeon]|nr:MAG: hypothetical protein DRJ51_00830 [Thermoprotei archaeon]RLF03596.1 MAG: hypothetical protein DRJ59_00195 [Thermoprotei archaeon]
MLAGIEEIGFIVLVLGFIVIALSVIFHLKSKMEFKEYEKRIKSLTRTGKLGFLIFLGRFLENSVFLEVLDEIQNILTGSSEGSSIDKVWEVIDKRVSDIRFELEKLLGKAAEAERPHDILRELIERERESFISLITLGLSLIAIAIVMLFIRIPSLMVILPGVAEAALIISVISLIRFYGKESELKKLLRIRSGFH